MRTSPTFLLACAVLLAACSSSPPSTSVADSRGGVPPGYPLDVDVVAPLVITTIGPDPIPVTGTDGKVHVAYELSVLNSGPRPATITQVETLADGPEGEAAIPLSSDNVPFEIDEFTFAGRLDGERFAPEATPTERTNQLPLAWDVIDFPPAP